MPLEAADSDEAIVGRQVKHRHVYMILISRIIFSSGFSHWLVYAGCQMKI